MNEFIQQWGDNAYANFTSFWGSLISIGVAVYACFSSSKANRRLIEIEEGRDAEARKSAAKASLVAKITTPHRHTYILIIENQGAGWAKDIVILLDDKTAHDHQAFSGGEVKSSLAPSASHTYSLTLQLGVSRPRSIRITWTDDSGEPGLYESDL